MVHPADPDQEPYVCSCRWVATLHARVSKCLPEFEGVKPCKGPLIAGGEPFDGFAVITAAFADFLPHLLGWSYGWALQRHGAPRIALITDFKVKTKWLGDKSPEGYEFKTSTLSDLDDHDLVVVRRTASRDRFIGPALYELAIQLQGSGRLWIVGSSEDPFAGLGTPDFDLSDLRAEFKGATRFQIAADDAALLAELGVAK